MLKLSKILSFFVLPVLFWGCECISPECNNPPSFKVADKTTHQNLIFSSQPKYSLDSIYATISNTDLPFRFHTYDSVNIIPNVYGAGIDTIYVHFDSSSIDTLVLKYHFSRHTYCCKLGISSVESATDNGVTLTRAGDAFNIEK